VPTLNISLPDPLQQFVEEQVASMGYSNVSEYMRDLVSADQKRKAKEQLEQMMLESLQSGEAAAVTTEMWADLKQHLRDRSKSPSA
jgi:antitoxin ParD1/3/4